MALNIKKVLISDEIDEKCVKILRDNSIEAVKNTKLSKEELLMEIPKYDGLIVRSATKVTAEVIEAGKNLKIIGRAGTGTDNIDDKAATKRGVVVMNTPAGNTLSAAEHTCCMIVCLARNIAEARATMREGKWDRKKFMGNELFGKTLAIVGLGRIGREVATRMQSFGMTTIGYDPIIPASAAAEFDVEWLELKDIWPRADYITVHTPLIPQTKNLLNDDVFAKCKKGVKIVNCARGGIIDEAALLRALDKGQCSGAGLDVFVEEPPPADDPIRRHPLVTCTPHLGASTVEAQNRVAEEIAQQIVDARDGKQLFGAINAQSLTNALKPEAQPYVELGTNLGRLAAALLKIDSSTTINLTTMGPNFSQAISYLPAACLIGLLNDDSLNLVSAPAEAKQRNITVNAQHHETPCGPCIDLEVKNGDTSVHFGGVCSLVHGVLVQLDGYFPQPVVLEGTLAFLKSKHFPKVMAAAGKSDKPIMTSFSTTKPNAASEYWCVLQVEEGCTSSKLGLDNSEVVILKFRDHAC